MKNLKFQGGQADIILFVLVIVVIIAGLSGLKANLGGLTGNDDSDTQQESVAQQSQNEVSEVSEPGIFEDYSPEKIAKASDGDVVLFFHATWCPTCKALENNINANLDKIPAGLNILKVNYDSETELKEKYGVRFQHTLVQVNAEGEVITAWAGGNTLDTIIERLK